MTAAFLDWPQATFASEVSSSSIVPFSVHIMEVNLENRTTWLP